MSKVRSLRTIARGLCLALLAGVVCPRAWAQGNEAAASKPKPARNGTIVLYTTEEYVVLSAGKDQGITQGTEYRILRAGGELARVRVEEPLMAMSRAKVVSGATPSQIRSNDTAEMVGAPPPKARKAGKFPWAALVGAGIIAAVVVGATRGKGGGSSSGGAADVHVN